MSIVTFLIILFVLLLVLSGMAWWLLRHEKPRTTRPPARKKTLVSAVQDFVDTAPAEVRPKRTDTDYGPETVLSYMDAQEYTQPPSELPSELSSFFPEDDAPSRPAESVPPANDAATDADHARIRMALQALTSGQVDKAWDLLKGFLPGAANREVALEVMDRLGVAFEKASRYDAARDVYEHMADIDAQWNQVKLRLLRARNLAQSATVNTWGTLPPRPMPEVRQRQLGKYIIEGQIGKGAMGAVYLGYDPTTDRKVALKTMALTQEFTGPDLADARARFLREAEMSGRLQHPDIVSIIDAGESDGLAYIAMELVEGTDLTQFTLPDRLLPLTTLLPIMARVAEALAYAHARGVTHRDIKPANIMVDLKRDCVKVMDFGVARVADATRTRTGVVLGTPTFMSPEQLSGQNIDGRSDLYSLGVTMFQLLTGQLPYRNDSMAILMRAIARDPVPNVCDLRPDLPAALGDIVALALEKHPNIRYASGLQMAEDLRAVTAGLQGIDIQLG